MPLVGPREAPPGDMVFLCHSKDVKMVYGYFCIVEMSGKMSERSLIEINWDFVWAKRD